MKGHTSPSKLKPFINILKTLYPNGICDNGLTIPLKELKEYNQDLHTGS